MTTRRSLGLSASRAMTIAALSLAARTGFAQTASAKTAPKAPAKTGAAPTTASSTATPKTAAQRKALLADPSLPFWKTHAPASFIADIETSKGKIAVEFSREWAPNGVDHFYNLARAGYYDDSRFYRVVPMFVAQFGLAGDPDVANTWGSQSLTIKADSVRESNVRGTLSFAQFKPTDRTTNVFINLRNNLSLDTLGFTPIARVVEGMEVADSLYSAYSDLPISDPPLGDVKRVYRESNKYLDVAYPKLDKIIRITIRQEP